MTGKILPSEVIEEDHRLEKEVKSSSEALARHRWYWVLDSTNPARVSITQYAASVARSYCSIHSYVYGYEKWLANKGNLSMTECIKRSRHTADRTAAIDFLARKLMISFNTVVSDYSSDSLALQNMAMKAADENDTIYEHELEEVGDVILAKIKARRSKSKPAQVVDKLTPEQKVEAAKALLSDPEVTDSPEVKREIRQAAERNAPVSPVRPPAQRGNATQTEIILGLVDKAEDKVKEAGKEAQGSTFTEQQKQFMSLRIDKLRDAVNRLDETLTGRPQNIDWDIEKLLEKK